MMAIVKTIEVNEIFVNESEMLRFLTEDFPGEDLLIVFDDIGAVEAINDSLNLLIEGNTTFTSFDDAVRILKAAAYLTMNNIEKNIFLKISIIKKH